MKRPPKNLTHMDISDALRGWDFQSGQVNVRLIRGDDGKPKLQMRLDLGLLQMELNGRPDGKRPHRTASELEFQLRKLRKHLQTAGSDAGFFLMPRDCQALREESAMFYHRYLSLFVLEQYEAVIRDTQHNIDVLDLCHKYGRSSYDRTCLEQYRPYILMMNSRARACEALKNGFIRTAMAYLRGGLKRIARIFRKARRHKEIRRSHEIHILLDMLKQIRSQIPEDPKTSLRKRLDAAVKAERYEEAIEIRNTLNAFDAIQDKVLELERQEERREKRSRARRRSARSATRRKKNDPPKESE